MDEVEDKGVVVIDYENLGRHVPILPEWGTLDLVGEPRSAIDFCIDFCGERKVAQSNAKVSDS